MEKERKMYEMPTMEVITLKSQGALLAGSNGEQGGGDQETLSRQFDFDENDI